MSESLVSVNRLSRSFGTFVAVNDVTFDLPRGKVFGFLGPNGSGKSTTIRVLTGLLAPTSGSVTGFGALDVTRHTEAWKRRLGYMSQKFSLYGDLTVVENLRFFGRIYGLKGAGLDARVCELSERLDIAAFGNALTEGLSTGLRQRVALAAALLHGPELLFLDEPTGGVDPRGRRLFWDLIYELAADRGMTVLVTTHYMDEAEQCDELAFILEGRLIARGTPVDLKGHLDGRLYEFEPMGDAFAVAARLRTHQAFDDVYLSGRRVRAVSHPAWTSRVPAILSAEGTAVPSEPSLEDVFVALARARRTSEEAA